MSESSVRLSDQQVQVIRRVTAHAGEYIEGLHATWRTADLTGNWWVSLQFWFSHCFYQGRRDTLSAMFEARALAVLEEMIDTHDASALRELAHEGLREGGPLDAGLLSAPLPKRNDRRMVLATLALIARLPDANLVNYSLERIREGRVEDLYDDLDSLPSVGDKIVAFYLRDLDFLFDLQGHIPESGYVLLQPLDTWAAEIALRIGIIPTKENSRRNRKLVVAACLESGISPSRFNVGAYWVGSRGIPIA